MICGPVPRSRITKIDRQISIEGGLSEGNLFGGELFCTNRDISARLVVALKGASELLS